MLNKQNGRIRHLLLRWWPSHGEPFRAAANTSAAHPSGSPRKHLRRAQVGHVPFPEITRLRKLSDEVWNSTAGISALTGSVFYLHERPEPPLASQIRTDGAHMEAVKKVSLYGSQFIFGLVRRPMFSPP